MNQWVAFIAAKRQYIARVAAGQFIWAAISWVYNHPLYIAAVAWYGPVVGGGAMTVGSLIICWGMVLWYNRKGVDWLGVGAMQLIAFIIESAGIVRILDHVGEPSLAPRRVPIRGPPCAPADERRRAGLCGSARPPCHEQPAFLRAIREEKNAGPESGVRIVREKQFRAIRY